MAAQTLLFHEQAGARLCEGLNMLADAVKVTAPPLPTDFGCRP